MRISLSTTLLADDSNVAVNRVPFGYSWNGEPIIDVVNFFRDTLAIVFARGDGPSVFGFNVQCSFSSRAELLLFCCTHRASLPIQADLQLVDETAPFAARMADAVRSVQIGNVVGLSCIVQYKFTGRQFLSEDVPDEDPEDVDLKKYGNAAPAEGDESIAIVFPTPFGGTPRYVDLYLVAPGGEDFVMVAARGGISATGFTAYFAAALPADGYIAYWKAEL